MRIVSKLVLAALALGACTTAASAAVNFTSPNPFDGPVGPGETMVWNFDTIMDTAQFSYSGDTFTSSIPNVAAEPAGDTSTYGAAEPGTNAVFSALSGEKLLSLSFYLGSLDTYNTISFYDGSTLVGSFTGSQLTIPNPADGNQSAGDTNRRYYFTFGAADDVNKVVFSSTLPAFEFDNIAAAISGVPEPATWAMMIIGFGFVGFMMRSNRQKTGLATV